MILRACPLTSHGIFASNLTHRRSCVEAHLAAWKALHSIKTMTITPERHQHGASRRRRVVMQRLCPSTASWSCVHNYSLSSSAVFITFACVVNDRCVWLMPDHTLCDVSDSVLSKELHVYPCLESAHSYYSQLCETLPLHNCGKSSYGWKPWLSTRAVVVDIFVIWFSLTSHFTDWIWQWWP